MGIAINGVVICPIGITDPKYPAAEPWFSGVCAIESAEANAGLVIPNPNPSIIIER